MALLQFSAPSHAHHIVEQPDEASGTVVTDPRTIDPLPGRWVIVIPTLNEAGNLSGLVDALMHLPLEDVHVVIVDDASSDGTGRIADVLAERYRPHVHVIHRPRRLGLGTAYRDGFRFALILGPDGVAQMDADGSHDPGVLPNMIRTLSGADVVIGSRFIPGGRISPACGRPRQWLSRWANVYARTIAGIRVHDAMTGYKVFRTEVLAGMDWTSIRARGYAFQMEMTWWCEHNGWRVREYPIVFHPRRSGRSKLTFSIVVEAAQTAWMLRIRRIARSHTLPSRENGTPWNAS